MLDRESHTLKDTYIRRNDFLPPLPALLLESLHLRKILCLLAHLRALPQVFQLLSLGFPLVSCIILDVLSGRILYSHLRQAMQCNAMQCDAMQHVKLEAKLRCVSARGGPGWRAWPRGRAGSLEGGQSLRLASTFSTFSKRSSNSSKESLELLELKAEALQQVPQAHLKQKRIQRVAELPAAREICLKNPAEHRILLESKIQLILDQFVSHVSYSWQQGATVSLPVQKLSRPWLAI